MCKRCESQSVWRGVLLSIRPLPNGIVEYTAKTSAGQVFRFTGDSAMQRKITSADIGRWISIDRREKVS